MSQSNTQSKFKDELNQHKSATSLKSFGEDGFNIWDIVDIVNPLQHIPVLSSFYRNITGDEMGTVAKLAGDTLYGGAIGAAFSVADIAMNAITGVSTDEVVDDTVQYAKNMFGNDNVMVADNQYDEEKFLTPLKSTTVSVNSEPLYYDNVSDVSKDMSEEENRNYASLWGSYTNVSMVNSDKDNAPVKEEWLDMDSFVEQSRKAYSWNTNNIQDPVLSSFSADI